MAQSFDSKAYAELFCKDAVPFAANECKMGDVLVLAPVEAPPHSMIVDYANGGNVWIRGYNNASTFTNSVPRPLENRYDIYSRALADAHLADNMLFRIPEQTYILAANAAYTRMMGLDVDVVCHGTEGLRIPKGYTVNPNFQQKKKK